MTEDEHECPTCERTFDTRQGLGQHHTAAHEISLREAEINDGHECPTCGDIFGSKQGMKMHHAHSHGESLAGEEFVCERCGSTFTALPSAVNRFCGEDCKNEAHSEYMKSEEAPQWNGGPATVECEQCGDEYSITPAKADSSRFCERSCQIEYQRENWQKDGHPVAGDWDVEICEACGEEYKVPPYKENSRFCRRACLWTWRSENIVGENHPCWEGGRVPYGEGWTLRKRRRVRIRDQARCQGCGMTMPEHLDEYGRKLSVHHITPVREFDDPKERNAMDNLVTLCIPCHRKYEQMAPLRPDSAPVGD